MINVICKAANKHSCDTPYLEDAGPQVAASGHGGAEMQRQSSLFRHAAKRNVVAVGNVRQRRLIFGLHLLVDAAQILQKAKEVAAQRLQSAAIVVQDGEKESLSHPFEELSPLKFCACSLQANKKRQK